MDRSPVGSAGISVKSMATASYRLEENRQFTRIVTNIFYKINDPGFCRLPLFVVICDKSLLPDISKAKINLIFKPNRFPDAVVAPDSGKRFSDRQDPGRQAFRIYPDFLLMVHRVPWLDYDGGTIGKRHQTG